MFELVSLYPFVVVLSDYPKLLSGLMVLQPTKVLKKVQHGAEEVEVTNPWACKLSITSPFGSVNRDKCNFASKQRMLERMFSGMAFFLNNGFHQWARTAGIESLTTFKRVQI